MSFYQLPRTNIFTYKHIDCKPNWKEPIFLSQSLSKFLLAMKEKITTKEKQWDTFKKYTNPFEYIHTHVPNKKKSVSKHKPLSRSFFKMVEIMHTFNIQFSHPIRAFHLAEGPGGFIEALLTLRKCPDDIYIGMTLLDDNKEDMNIPAWKKSEYFLKSHTNVFLEHGKDDTGNILSLENFEYVINKYPEKMDIITADGGFNFSVDFNQQEILIGKLLFAQIAFAVCLQKQRGTFILKVFDCFMQHTADLLYLLSSFYEKVYIMKPNTSRYANSEKYIICIGFLYDSSAPLYSHFFAGFESMTLCDDVSPLRFLNIEIPDFFTKKLEEYNAIFGQKQIQNIHYTLSLLNNKMKTDKIDTLIQTNVQKSIDWCNRFHIPFNKLNTPINIFLQGEA